MKCYLVKFSPVRGGFLLAYIQLCFLPAVILNLFQDNASPPLVILKQVQDDDEKRLRLIREQQNGGFKVLFQRLNVTRRIPAIDNAVVAADRQVHKLARLNVITNKHRPLDDLVRADYSHLWAVYDRRGGNAPQRPQRRHSER